MRSLRLSGLAVLALLLSVPSAAQTKDYLFNPYVLQRV